MDFFDLFRSFQPLRNPIGFGASDFLEFMLAALLLLYALTSRRRLEPLAEKFAKRTGWCMALLAVLPVVLRLTLLPHHPVPSPDIYDEFSHLLVADTLRHLRLANAVHPMHRFFETFFVLQQPSYSSIYPIGQGLALAIGRAIFATPWAGVVLSTAAFYALCYWMLRGWTTPGWALLGGLLAVIEFGPLNQWMNTYWGGAVPASAGCLVFGALPRLTAGTRARDAVCLGIGLGVHLLTRQFESIFLLLSVVLFFVPLARQRAEWPKLLRMAAIVTVVVAPAILVTLLQNKAVTGSWTTTPEMLSQYQYGVPAALTVQAEVTPHLDLTPQQQMDYRMQSSFRGAGPETIESYFVRLEYRVRYYRFFFLPPLYLALIAFFWNIHQFRYLWVALTALLFALGTNFFPAFQFHYVAACTCLFILMSVSGLERISRWKIAGPEAAQLIVLLCVAPFLFWYGVHLFDDSGVSQAMRRYEMWDNINHQNPERRINVNRQLAAASGQQLVFVRYWRNHVFQEEWVFNDADIDASRVVWARDLGGSENEKLRRYYPGRSAWILEPDARPPRLSPYQALQLENAGGPP